MNDTSARNSGTRGGEMSFLEHLDELRKRLMNSIIFVIAAFILCWFVSGYIYNFLSIPIRRELSQASRRELPVRGLTGAEAILPIDQLNEGDSGRYIFDQPTNLGAAVVASGSSVLERSTLHANRSGFSWPSTFIIPHAAAPLTCLEASPPKVQRHLVI